MIIFDAHCDTLSLIYDYKKSLYSNGYHIDIKRLQKYDKYIQVFAIWSDPDHRKNLYNRFKNIYNYFLEQINEYSNDIELGIITDNKVSSILSLEGLDFISNTNEIKRLEYLKDLGIKSIGLTWNYKNSLACGIMEDIDTGLTYLGCEVVKKMNDLNILIDVSHLSQKSFWQVLEITSKPVIASHSNSYRICGHKRNLTDQQFKAILNNKGAIGLNFYKEFLTEKEKCTVNDILNHIEHFLSLGGKNSIGLGTDFDGMSVLPEEINGCENIDFLINAMFKINYSEEIVIKILGNNIFKLYTSIIN